MYERAAQLGWSGAIGIRVAEVTTDRIADSDGELLNVLQELGPLAWRKYHARYPELLVRGRIQRFDQSKSPPSFAFRFEDEREDGIELLLRAVERYHGELHWTMYGRKRQGLPGTNWVIYPIRVLDVIEVALEQGLPPPISIWRGMSPNLQQ